MSKEYIISDLHFGDDENGIIAFERRPFADKDTMIRALISFYNSVVTKDDIVYNLGDVFWGLTDEERKSILSKLNGRKILIMGNHDRDHDAQYWRDLGFEEVYDHPIIIRGFLILSHEPLYMTVGPYFNFFGHVHGNKIYKDYCSTGFCACVERETMQYRPIEIDEALKLARKAS